VTSSATLTANKPASLADKDLLIAVPYSRNTGTWTTVPAGWTELHSQNTVGHLSVFAKPIPVAASETASNYTWVNSSSNRGGIAIFRVTSAYPAIPLDATGTPVTVGTATIVDPAVTAGKTDTLLLAVNVTSQTSSPAAAISPPASMTELAALTMPGTGSSLSYLEIAVQGLSAAGSTGTRTFTCSPTVDGAAAGLMLTLAPLMYGSVTLTAASGLADVAGKAAVYGAAALSAGSALLSTGRLRAKGATDLSVVSALTATPPITPLNCLSSDGTWQPTTLYQNVSGSWVQS
jgi:hypothetical protein